MKRFTITAALALAASFGIASAATPMPLQGSHYLPQAKVTPAKARAIALAKEHGTIVDQELEKEGGSLRYSFDVKVGSVVHEVGVDAVSGKIVEDSIDHGND